MRGPLLFAAMCVVGCRSQPDRAARIETALRTLCGDRYAASIVPSVAADPPGSGCRRDDDDLTGIFASYTATPEARRFEVAIGGDQASLPGQIAAVTEALAPLLDAEQRRVIAEELPMLVPHRFRPYEGVIGRHAISAATRTGEVPWDRWARVTVSFDVAPGAKPRPPMATTLARGGESLGWSKQLGIVDHEVLARWQAWCAGGGWHVGDVWARCERSDGIFWAEWAPPTRHLLRAHLAGPGDLAGDVETLLFPLLTAEQRATVSPAITADLDNRLDPSRLDVYVRSEHRADHHAFWIDVGGFR